MDNKEEHLETLREIRVLMDRSSRFTAQSGLTGILVGLIAIVGVLAIYFYLGLPPGQLAFVKDTAGASNISDTAYYSFVFADGILVFILSVLIAVFLTRRKAETQNHPVWNGTIKRLLLNLLIPMITGAIYGLILLFHNQMEMIPAVSLIFYGMGLINASKYTLNEIRVLGFFEIIIGLLAAFHLDFSLLYWALGFGILHIVYGITLYLRYDK